MEGTFIGSGAFVLALIAVPMGDKTTFWLLLEDDGTSALQASINVLLCAGFAALCFGWWHSARGAQKFLDDRMISYAQRRWLPSRSEAEDAYYTFSPKSQIGYAERHQRLIDFEGEFEAFLRDEWMKERVPETQAS